MLRASQTEEIICDTLLDLMQEKSLFTIKVTELVKQANISRSSFYSYFSSIEDVIQKIEDDFIDGLRDESDVDLKRLENWGTADLMPTLNYIKKNAYMFRTLIGDNGDPYFQYRIANRSTRLLDGMVTDVKKQMLIEYLNGGRWQMYKWWVENEDEITVEEVAELTNKIIKQAFDLLLD